MDCHEADKILPLYVSDDLDSAERAGLDEHLAGCPDCLEAVNLFRKDRENIQSLAEERPDAGDNYLNGVLQKIARQNIRQRSNLTVWLPLAAAAAIVLVVSLVIFSGAFTPGPVPMVEKEGPAMDVEKDVFKPVRYRRTTWERMSIPTDENTRTAEF